MDDLDLSFSPLKKEAPPSGSAASIEAGDGPRPGPEKKMFLDDELGDDFLFDLRRKSDMTFEPSPHKPGAIKKLDATKQADMLDFDLTDFGASIGKVKNTANFDWTADLEKGGGFDLFKAFEIPSSPEKFRPENSPHVQALQKGIEDLPVFRDPTEGSVTTENLEKESNRDQEQVQPLVALEVRNVDSELVKRGAASKQPPETGTLEGEHSKFEKEEDKDCRQRSEIDDVSTLRKETGVVDEKDADRGKASGPSNPSHEVPVVDGRIPNPGETKQSTARPPLSQQVKKESRRRILDLMSARLPPSFFHRRILVLDDFRSSQLLDMSSSLAKPSTPVEDHPANSPMKQSAPEAATPANDPQTADMDISPFDSIMTVAKRGAPESQELAEEIIKKGEIAKKADEYTKELDQMYASLKKKHEEAKDLLVKALINNNRMQMLNNPVTEDKISFALLFLPTLDFQSSMCP
ncbi:hypothetical protein KFL_000320340 [Klebsormidium nitens]|uniref:Uncharacterized protein n=1 Tax=Klebsormidium nitens TaxID=105231 RepID=A0A1Y1HSJ6_KLENI|nr:hypothetical protein KFL_000320340 [Klebsormidium nitens]|eukprot:GAQ79536.1 hypothetical protein KFL_000320340 [Klebsormidium nitens]